MFRPWRFASPRSERTVKSLGYLNNRSRPGTPGTRAETKRVLACFIQLSKSRYSQASWKDYGQTPILQMRVASVKQFWRGCKTEKINLPSFPTTQRSQSSQNQISSINKLHRTAIPV